MGFERLPTGHSVSWPMEEELVVARFPFVLGLSFLAAVEIFDQCVVKSARSLASCCLFCAKVMSLLSFAMSLSTISISRSISAAFEAFVGRQLNSRSFAFSCSNCALNISFLSRFF